MSSSHNLNPWLAEQIEVFRSRHTEEELRIMYQSATEKKPELSWQSFIADAALREKVKAEPILLQRRDDMNLSVWDKEALHMINVEILADLVQFPVEQIEDIPCFFKDTKRILEYAEHLGYPLRHCTKPVTMEFLSEYHDEYDLIVAHVEGLILEARSKMADNCIKEAVMLYEEAEAYASKNHYDRLNYERLIREYSETLVYNYLLGLGRDYVDKAEQYALLEIDESSQVYGPKHTKTGDAHRVAGDILLVQGNYTEAGQHYLETAGIKKESLDVLNSCKNLEDAAYCYNNSSLVL